MHGSRDISLSKASCGRVGSGRAGLSRAALADVFPTKLGMNSFRSLISADILEQIVTDLKETFKFSLQLDESTDVADLSSDLTSTETVLVPAGGRLLCTG